MKNITLKLCMISISMTMCMGCHSENDDKDSSNLSKIEDGNEFNPWGSENNKEAFNTLDPWAPPKNQQDDASSSFKDNIIKEQIAGEFIFPRQTLNERSLEIIRLIETHKIKDGNFDILISSRIDSNFIVEELKMINPSLFKILQYTCGRQGIRFEISERSINFYPLDSSINP